MQTLTFLAYRGDNLILESDDETDCRDYDDLVNGLRNRLDCTRVVLIADGEVVADTNGMGQGVH